ncbi:helix-turn-helix transcriptional regulator [Microbispora sp. ZYX-F-249]|uniref:Helix-turn-helix transcriptional regulator n=1 Tax=Microbispora maris TaxID=3144104 RepID=A0ABV0AM10_9ACTN
MSSTELGAFLKARRGLVQPSDVGITAQSGRRVSGLRREEVAMLAGVSVDYYTRLEQGRERNPSPAVLNALAGALDLDADLREHVFRLAGLAPAPRRPVQDAVDDSLRELLAAWTHTPALIINRQLDVLAYNDLAGALYNGFERIDNLARMTFIDPFGRRFFTDWERATTTCVANLRLALGHTGSAEHVRALVAEAHAKSAEFRLLWDRREVRGKTHEAKAFRHPDVGDLLLEFNAFDVRSAPGLQLVVYQAPSGSPSAEKLRLLGSLAVSVDVDR